MSSPIIASLCSALSRAGIHASTDAVLRDFTTFRLGGRCLCLATCRTPAQLQAAVRAVAAAGMESVLIGGGSNLLISDRGLEAVVLRYVDESVRVRQGGDVLEVEASMSLDELARYTAEEGLAGLVYCSGIPGTVGGAIAGNAGAFGKQLGDHVVSVRVLDRRGDFRDVDGSELEFAYRSSRLLGSGEVVVSARLRMECGSADALQKERSEILGLRSEKHPDWRIQPTAGSFFKNIEPTSAADRRQAAGWFLDQVGAKGMKVGGARVFEKHANIIVADAGCKAQDVLDLSRQMAAAVKAKFGFDLTPEVRVLGSFG